MRVALRGRFTYGNRELEADVELEFDRKLVLIGPNASGKSLVLKCVHDGAGRKLGSPRVKLPAGVECMVDRNDYVAVFVDAHRLALQLHELVRDSFKQVRNVLDYLSKQAEDQDIKPALSGAMEELRKAENDIAPDLDVLVRLKLGARWDLWADAYTAYSDLLNRLLNEVKKDVTPELIGEFIPVLLDLSEGGFVWRDESVKADGRGLSVLSTGFSPSLVLLYALLAYANSYEPVVLVVEEPEAHASPLAAFLLGAYLRRLMERSENFGVAVSTHSLDFLYGIGPPAYLIVREQGKISMREKWNGSGVVPMFTDTAVYRYSL